MGLNINYIIKLGGSVLTGKSSSPSFDQSNTKRIIEELVPFYSKSIFIHGTGSYGKPPAIKYGYYKSGIISKKNRAVALKVKYSIRQLNKKVLDLFHLVNIPAMTFDINSYYDPQKDIINKNQLIDWLLELTNQDILPVFYGDLVLMENGDYRVLSSDEIVFALAKIIHPESVIFLSDVEGVFLDAQESNNRESFYMTEELNSTNIQYLHKESQDRKDVSGSMKKKAYISLEISKYCNKCFIGNGYTAKMLQNFISGEKVFGTYVTG